MSISRRDAMIAGAALPTAALLATAAQAQPRGGQPAVVGGNEDPVLAAMLLGGGKRQIEVCKFAKTLTKNAEVLAFLQAEIDEHETIKAKVKQQFGFNPPMPAAANGTAPVVTLGPVAFQSPASNILAVEGEIVDQCIANYKAKMPKYAGVKLDKAVIGDQLHAHQGLQDKVQVFLKHASPAMQPVLKEGLAIIAAHIEKCEQIMAKLDGMKDEMPSSPRTGARS